MVSYTELVSRRGRNKESDECYTPRDAVGHLIPFLTKGATYYEATSGKSSQMLEGFRSLGVDIRPSGDRDFFECGVGDIFDGVVTNPPYSQKDKFLKHCYELGKPFALLLPVTTFQGQKRGKMFQEYGMSALVYNKRVDFTGKGSPPFGVAWFMGNGMCEPNRVWWV